MKYNSSINKQLYNYLNDKYELEKELSLVEKQTNKEIILIDIQEMFKDIYRLIYSIENNKYFIIDINDKDGKITSIQKMNKKELLDEGKQNIASAILGSIIKKPKESVKEELELINDLKIKNVSSQWEKLAFEEKQKIFMNSIRNFLDGDRNSLIISGPPGTGKSFAINKVLREFGIDTLEAVEKITVSKSGRGLFDLLKQKKDLHVLVLDDSDSVFTSDSNLNILKGVLDSSRPAIVSWSAHGNYERFQFDGKIIFITNLSRDYFKKNAHLSAITSRSSFIDYTLYKQDWKVFWMQMAKDEKHEVLKQAYQIVDLETRLLIVESLYINYDLFPQPSARLYIEVVKSFSESYLDNMKQFLYNNADLAAKFLKPYMTVNYTEEKIKDYFSKITEDDKQKVFIKIGGKRLIEWIIKNKNLLPELTNKEVMDMIKQSLLKQVERD